MKKRYPARPPGPMGEVHEESCRHCGGTGQEPGLSDLTCRECIGRGRRKWRIEECRECGGNGRKTLIFTCKSCRGKGWLGRDIG